LTAQRPFLYDPRWATLFEEEAARLHAVLEPWLVEGIHHVGSTSIPGMAAKPVIDMIAGVRDLAEARAAFEPLTTLGYGHREHRIDAHAFHKPPNMPTQWEETHHLHLTVPGSDLWRERLAFRDALRASPPLAREYMELKMRYYGQPNSPGVSKHPFVERVLASAGIPLKPDDQRLVEAVLKERHTRLGRHS
jgi:GrpB-like predicted nucleotidyltransferase (UPF0157 family)